ncbi:tetratricopeptide repeat protein [Selenomonadales bacterium OttesenSCG-928-I06]|nr:tetratricopeptide repeat protein [Selenomonadales bacterium OttesenSCG-928-I06]
MKKKAVLIIIFVIALFVTVNNMKSETPKDDAFFISQAKNTGLTLVMVNNYDSAIEYYNKALAIDPNDSECYYWLAIAYSGKEDSAQALNNFNKAIELDPKYIEAYTMRSELHRKMGNQDLAEEDLRKAASLKKI